ncbi:Uma2 family endonuclease [Pseudanabaena sp. UWO311]|uniref:Uma2 family endonuclease n=1 Tax=Pseudanabaena sp. UWO311 TaxID=2487337 RepID=UPI00115AD5F9|nr:Uma2 family endonuclease [Pseudanabaena sp. UWO311]TYQ28285.1 Uma2 family endonuclease [Pseudanabaena sp. UWO311]
MILTQSKPNPEVRIEQPLITWEQFKLIQRGFADARGIRLAYYEGILEIVSTSVDHELIKTIIGALLELYFLEMEIEFFPMGQATQEKVEQVSLQPDESYSFGSAKKIPDLTIEVILTSGNTEKLKKYYLLGVPEVWLWEDGVLDIYHLDTQSDRQYCKSSTSKFLPNLDMATLQRCILFTSPLEALKTFRQAFRQSL